VTAADTHMAGKTATFLRAQATGRRVLIALAAALLLALVSRYAAVPMYRGIVGFTPFDAQPSLSRIMVAVELGASGNVSATSAYLLFAAIDAVAVAAAAWLFAALWMWLFVRVPTRLFAFLMRGGIVLLPFYVVALDMMAKVAFFRLVRGLSGESYAATIEFAVAVHRLKFAFVDVRNYLTAALLFATVLAVFLRRRQR
jgi:hypothetical protein